LQILLSEAQLQQGIQRMADDIRRCYQGKSLSVIGVMIGSVVLLADLIRRLDRPLKVDLVQARSYRGTQSGDLTIQADMLGDLRERHVLLIDDIFDTGRTLAELTPQIAALGPASLKTAVLLRKTGQSRVAMTPDFVAFDIPNVFVVGFGLDYCDSYRNLPYVAALEAPDLAEEHRP